ncbi:PP0621 family protein [Thiomicrorhabdus indica]|uniref:PP0621 family protein n=1 Tax=Thiomicrorhabdus indica TaxID=2267253 RepID=UPI00102DEAEE|nr:PP0621 family protein [Thiomicrorhabdus indica]
MRSLLFFFAVIAVFIVVMIAATRIQTLRSSMKKKNPKKPSKEKPMVKCAHCGVYLPKNEAITDKNQTDSVEPLPEEYFCCQEHHEAFIKDKSNH